MSQRLVTSLRNRSQPAVGAGTRTVLISRTAVSIGETDFSHSRHFPNNRIVTSKYTSLNFIPKNLFEQFRRIANFYFLCIAVIQVTTNSPVSPITSLAPLIFVVSTTALKQGYEDYLRHRMDRATNNRMFPVLRNGHMRDTRSEDIEVGDIVLVKDNQEISCDMVLISCINSSGKCHVTTANLDGETNLKVRECPETTKSLQSPDSLSSLKGVIECEKPNSDLYEFIGTLRLEDAAGLPLGPENLLIRGSRLQNTAFVYGVAVYTGPETKLALNSRLTSNKFSSVEKTANRYLIAYLTILVALSATFTVIRFLIWQHPVMGTAWYFKSLFTKPIDASFVFEEFFAFFVIFNYVIPISLYVTLETVKFFGSKTLVNDPDLMDPETLERPRCNSSDLNEELGQVEYLFSDKTGTLTENRMRFTSCLSGDSRFDDQDGRLVQSAPEAAPVALPLTGPLLEFFLAIAVCNTARVESSSDGGKHYSADSPDEKALVEAANRYGVSLIESSDKSCAITVGDKRHVFKKLQVLAFDTTRKRSSVIVEDEAGKIRLISKGAESELLGLSSGEHIHQTSRQIDEYAAQGLRTLVFAHRQMTREEYDDAASKLDTARRDVTNRNDAVIKAQIGVEQHLQLLGATAVEDKLQDGVAETIHDLKEAGIKIWVLTGDKLETAVSVATSCGLIEAEGMERMILARQANADSCGEVISRFLTATELDSQVPSHDVKAKYLVVDGRSLHLAMKSHVEKFRKLCSRCRVVVCCRMSPIQKAEVVRMVKTSPRCPVTAAIGDGANDVSMIQEAHVGFGLMGREGRQAVNAADFAFSRFRFLKPVLLVHGALFYHRVSNLIHFFFYKNVIFVAPQVLFSFYNVFATQTLYHGMLLMLYNMMFTATPILCFGIGEHHVPNDVLLSQPQLYKTISRNSGMRVTKFFSWFVNGCVHGIITFFFFVLLWSTSSIHSGFDAGLFAFGLSIFHVVVLTVTLKLFLVSRLWTAYFFSCSLVSVASLFLFLSVYSSFKWSLFDDNLFGVYGALLSSPNFWLALIICPVISLIPDVVTLVLRNAARNRTSPDKLSSPESAVTEPDM